VTTDEARSAVAELERARAHIETVLGGNAEWLALRRSAAASGGRVHGRALAANPLYRSWTLLNQAIQDLRAGAAQAPEPDPVPAADTAGEAAQAPHAAIGAGARRIELHHILAYIRDAAALGGDAASAAGAPAREAPPPAAPAIDDVRGDNTAEAGRQGPQDRQREAAGETFDDGTPSREDAAALAPEPEEATVTFVIREHLPAAGADDDPVHPDAQDGLADRWAEVGGDDSLYAPTDGPIEEAEVVIVSRPSRHPDRHSRKG
jgi:hypothetical protein